MRLKPSVLKREEDRSTDEKIYGNETAAADLVQHGSRQECADESGGLSQNGIEKGYLSKGSLKTVP